MFQKGLKNYQSQGTFTCQSHETATLLVSFEGKLVSSCVTSVRGFGFAQIRIMGGFLDRNPGGKIRESVTFSIIIKISSQRIAQMKGPDDSTKIKYKLDSQRIAQMIGPEDSTNNFENYLLRG